MGKLNRKEKKELRQIADSAVLKKDMQYLADHRFTPLTHGQHLSMDRWLAFLTEYNEFINHIPKPFKPIKDRIMKL
ncbi:MAG: hypothetical protein Q8P24_01835 [Desulfobacterales bacterium]|nr:hypothetical protein [Desulfobacterales bacterium]